MSTSANCWEFMTMEREAKCLTLRRVWASLIPDSLLKMSQGRLREDLVTWIKMLKVCSLLTIKYSTRPRERMPWIQVGLKASSKGEPPKTKCQIKWASLSNLELRNKNCRTSWSNRSHQAASAQVWVATKRNLQKKERKGITWRSKEKSRRRLRNLRI